jgi:hypothetical protein
VAAIDLKFLYVYEASTAAGAKRQPVRNRKKKIEKNLHISTARAHSNFFPQYLQYPCPALPVICVVRPVNMISGDVVFQSFYNFQEIDGYVATIPG